MKVLIIWQLIYWAPFLTYLVFAIFLKRIRGYNYYSDILIHSFLSCFMITWFMAWINLYEVVMNKRPDY